MNSRAARGALLAATLVAVAFVAGRSCAPVETVFVERSTAPSRGPREQRPPRRRETPRAADVAAEAAAAAEAALAAESAAASADADAFPAVDVEVVRADGTPESRARVYALAAGAPGVDDIESVPHVECDDAGRGRLRLPRAGRYDVATWPSFGDAMATDVDAPGAHVVRLTLPETSTLMFHFADDARPRPGEKPDDFFVYVSTLSGDDAIDCPGRGQRLRWSQRTTFASLPAGQTTFPIGWPRGVPAEVLTRDPIVARPARVAGPADVRISRNLVSSFAVNAGIVFAEPDRTWQRSVAVRIDVRWNDGEPVPWAVDLYAGNTLQSAFDGRWTQRLERPAGVVRWSGPGFLSGELAYADVATNGSAVILLPVRLDPASDLPDSTQLVPRRRFRIAAPPDVAADAEVSIRMFDARGEVESSATVQPGAIVESDPVPIASVVATCGAWVSRLVAPSGQPDAVVDVALERGGYLVVVPDGPLPPEEVGRVWLERIDGAPLAWLYARGENDSSRWPAVRAGLVLGPLLPGPVSFRVRATGGDLGEARAVVRVGKYDVLRLPRLASR